MATIGKLYIVEGVSRCGKSSFIRRNFHNTTTLHPYNDSAGVGAGLRGIYVATTDKNRHEILTSSFVRYSSIGCHMNVVEQAVEICAAGLDVVLDRSIFTVGVYNMAKNASYRKLATLNDAMEEYWQKLPKDIPSEFIYLDTRIARPAYSFYDISFYERNRTYLDFIHSQFIPGNVKITFLDASKTIEEVDQEYQQKVQQ